ncbi:MAG TPA: type II toxin-antitoxin system HicB family antitoxin [Longimicrobium sp.]|jgi:predicted RNase H-like HicB family nuclease
MSTEMHLTAVFQKVPEGYIGWVQELPGANTQGASLDEARENLQEAVMMVLEANRILAEEEVGSNEVIREPLLIRAA